MFKLIQSFFDPGKKLVTKYQKVVPVVRTIIEDYQQKSNEELVRIIDKYRSELRELSGRIPEEQRLNLKMRKKSDELSSTEMELYKRIQEIMPEAYAILAIMTERKLGISHFDVQILAGALLASGQKLVEMKTGEGKTMTFQLPLFLYGLTGRGAHLVTVNDYLARRDGEYAGHIFSELGLSVGIITPAASYKFIKDEQILELKGAEAAKERKEQQLKVSSLKGLNLIECTKREAYECDVVVGTNNEFGFDYLRDNMARSADGRVQGELYFCIVDEADSILIDEARTPLIISAPASGSNDLYQTFSRIVPKLKAEVDFTIEEKERAVNLTDEGIAKVEKLLGVNNVWEDYKLAHHLENSLKAEVFYKLDKEYIIREGEVMIVDEFTGRVLPGRRYSEGLHQAIEAKEGVAIQQESRTLATITFQNFFRLYKILTGGSGTILTEQEEFFKIYNLEAAEIPTNKTNIRQDKADRIYKSKEAKFEAVVSEIVAAHKSGRPILVGTTSIADSEKVSSMLDKRKIEHEVLNAKFHEREAQIVAKAGQVGAVTVATNMAGRGTDIPLGEGAADKGGLYVIGTERHESRRIDNQLRGRSGRQGDAGETRFFVSLDDQIMRIQGGEIVKRIMEMTNLPDDLPLESGMITSSIERAQKRMEGMYFDSRKHVVEYDDVVNQQREIFYNRRYRYLTISKEFAGKEAGSQEHKEALADLAAEFGEAIAIRSALIASNLESSDDKQKPDYAKLAQLVLSLGDDQTLIVAGNRLKLFKDEVTDTAALQEVMTGYLTKTLEQEPRAREKLEEFLESFLRTAVEIKLENTNSIQGLIQAVLIEVIDELWTLHLDYMQDVREGIGLRGVAQLDPLVEYKNEGFTAFSNFIEKCADNSLTALLQVRENAIRLRPENGNSQVITNAAQISDLLTGDREIAGRRATRPMRIVSSADDGRKGGMSRSQRRKMERLGKKGK